MTLELGTYFEVGLKNTGLDFEALFQRVCLDDGDSTRQDRYRGRQMDMARIL
jgi:hypothetical protein